MSDSSEIVKDVKWALDQIRAGKFTSTCGMPAVHIVRADEVIRELEAYYEEREAKLIDEVVNELDSVYQAREKRLLRGSSDLTDEGRCAYCGSTSHTVDFCPHTYAGSVNLSSLRAQKAENLAETRKSL